MRIIDAAAGESGIRHKLICRIVKIQPAGDGHDIPAGLFLFWTNTNEREDMIELIRTQNMFRGGKKER